MFTLLKDLSLPKYPEIDWGFMVSIKIDYNMLAEKKIFVLDLLDFFVDRHVRAIK